MADDACLEGIGRGGGPRNPTVAPLGPAHLANQAPSPTQEAVRATKNLTRARSGPPGKSSPRRKPLGAADSGLEGEVVMTRACVPDPA